MIQKTPMANRPRKHHYIPAFYLAGFTASGSDEDRLYVFDQGQIKSWPSSPKNSGHERDFYAVDLGPDVDPASFETGVLARLETEFSRVVRETVAAEKLPEGDDFNILLNFVAAMATRTPRTRRLVGQVTDLAVKSHMQATIATDEGWREFRAYFNEPGDEMSDAEAEGMRQFILSGKYDVNLDQTSHVQKIGELVGGMLPLLAQRCWSIGVVPPGFPNLVCSDAPVSGAPTEQFGPDDEMHLANRNILLTMPLTRRIVLFGRDEDRPSMFYINELGVLTVNAMTITEARQIFSTDENFAYLGSDKQARQKADLEESLRRRNGKYSHLDEALVDWFQTRMQTKDNE